jgi:hypothetical protein
MQRIVLVSLRFLVVFSFRFLQGIEIVAEWRARDELQTALGASLDTAIGNMQLSQAHAAIPTGLR